MEPFSRRWPELSAEVLQPVHILSRHPFLLARFGLAAFPPANTVANLLFRDARAKALFAGLAAHSFLSLDEPLSAAVAVLLGAAAHAVGWPIPRGGAQSITRALCDHLVSLGGKIRTSTRVENLSDLGQCDFAMCDVTPRQLLHFASDRLSAGYKTKLERFRYGVGVFKVDYALSSPIPWKAKDCLRAATVHIGGSAEEITASESAARKGIHSDRPFVLLAQPSLFDPSRTPEGKHDAWAYCHVPNGSNVDMLDRIENQIERFAPGFRDCVLARRVLSPASLEAMDTNLVGGDINGGALDLRQFSFAPHRTTTSHRRLTYIYVRPRHLRAAASMACVAITPQTKHFGDSDNGHPKIRTWRPPHWMEFRFRVFVPSTDAVRIRDFHSQTWARAPFWK